MFVSEMELLKARLAVGKGLSDSHILRQILQEDAASEKKKRMREGERYYQGEHDITEGLPAKPDFGGGAQAGGGKHKDVF